ncbi:MAG: DUF3343 domain-containing protein [Phycisphaerae bacterium]|jgi:hypothetical protein|nr:DUF3343 domain-containing protein [Phycisphaerae bacterium]MDP7288983.1 DUF3343 domain-containing protein [Phycisphaerae bacterium]
MNDESYSVAVFHNIHAMFLLKKELDRLGVEVKAIPTPRHISSDCGSALRFDTSQQDVVRAAIRNGRLEIQGIHELDK